MKKQILAVFLLFFTGVIYAQNVTLATGGEASGTGGEISYSIGQVVYTTDTGTNGSVAKGLQQPYEISSTLGIEIMNIKLELSIYPNPTSGYLTLIAKNIDLSTLTFQLYDIQGKLLESNKIKHMETSIRIENLTTSTYFLKIMENGTSIKTFKILKK